MRTLRWSAEWRCLSPSCSGVSPITEEFNDEIACIVYTCECGREMECTVMEPLVTETEPIVSEAHVAGWQRPWQSVRSHTDRRVRRRLFGPDREVVEPTTEAQPATSRTNTTNTTESALPAELMMWVRYVNDRDLPEREAIKLLSSVLDDYWSRTHPQ